MRSKILIPRALSCVSFFLLLNVGLFAQSHSLSEAWKTPTISENRHQSANSSPEVAKAEKLNSEKLPVEPAVKIANPSLSIESGELRPSTANLALPANITPADELTGLEPPKTFQATAYSLLGRTRSGVHVRRGVLAADPHVLPIGSVVHLKAGNYSGVYTVHDTGGAIRGKKIDVWMPSSHEARSFGRRSVRLTVLKYGRGHSLKH